MIVTSQGTWGVIDRYMRHRVVVYLCWHLGSLASMGAPKYPKISGVLFSLWDSQSLITSLRVWTDPADWWWWIFHVSRFTIDSLPSHRPYDRSVFRATHIEDHRVAACKLVSLSHETSEKDRKTIEKEIRVHSALKHSNVLEFIDASVVEPQHKHQYVPGIYMLLEFAAGGDLFDKIGGSHYLGFFQCLPMFSADTRN
jgi:serine/threonine protein kinase